MSLRASATKGKVERPSEGRYAEAKK